MLDVKTIHFCEVYNNQSLNIRHQTGFERLLKTQFSVTEMKGSVMLGSLLVTFICILIFFTYLLIHFEVQKSKHFSDLENTS